MKTIEVNDKNNSVRLFPLVEVKDVKLYFLIYHNELTMWQNFLANIPLLIIKQKKKENQ